MTQDFSQLVEKHTLLQEQLKQANNSRADLTGRHTKLQEQFQGLKEAVNVLDQQCKSADEKLLLQTQLHANRLRTIEATHKNIKERCMSLAVSAEQHKTLSVKLEAANSKLESDNARLLSSNLKLDERHKSTIRDIEKLTELHAKAVQSNLAKQNEIRQLSMSGDSITSMKDEHAKEIASLKAELKASFDSKIESQATETKRLQSKIQAATALLKAHPIDPLQNAKTKNILASSAEILQLAHTNGSLESMHQCLGQVADVLNDLKGQLNSQHRLSQAWLDQIDKIDKAQIS